MLTLLWLTNTFQKVLLVLLSFEVDNKEMAQGIADKTEIFKVVVNIGDSKSIITHPASTTHQQLSAQELVDCGIPCWIN